MWISCGSLNNEIRGGHLKSLTLLFCCAIGLSTANAEDFKITIYREYPGHNCTPGYLAVNDQIIVYTLERPWADNQNNISSIPAGLYDAFLRYDHDDHWRIELLNVPNRDHIEIHVGNTIDDTTGCILVGSGVSASNPCLLTGSATAYSKLMNAFYGTDNPNSTPDKTITVQI